MRRARLQLERLPQQYFTALLAQVVSEHAALEGEPLVDLGRGQPRGRAAAARDRRPRGGGAISSRLTGIRRFAGCRRCARRSRLGTPALRRRARPGHRGDDHAGDEDGDLRARARARRARVDDRPAARSVLPGLPVGAALAAARTGYVPLDRDAGWAPHFAAAPRDDVSAVFLNFPRTRARSVCPRAPSRPRSPTRRRPARQSSTTSPTATSSSTGTRPESFLAEPGAKEVGVEMFSLSKTYGMAGWRLGFVVGNAEIVARLDLLADHARVGIFSGSSTRGSRRSPGRRTRSQSGSRRIGGGATGCGSPPPRHRRGLVLSLVGAAGGPDPGAAAGAPGRCCAGRGLRLPR